MTAVASNQSLGDFLRQMAKETKLNFTRIDDQIYVSKRKNLQQPVIEKLTAASILQQRTITGTITSLEDNMPLPGVSVILKGTSTGTVTDLDGKYTIDAPDGAVLVFSYVGFITEESVVGNSTVINMVLSPDLTQLDEIVVIGYGTVKKSDLTGSVSSVKSEELTAYPAINAVQSLQGTGCRCEYHCKQWRTRSRF
ncbi:MAG: carboxypeptidase-like regulatory domain-containing protein [Cyclobacteriaceae bacterium]|nr:carboxypeptidase-like regulatory domain-containing protein [Cyclobacteriaceae bacterium]